jgi:cell division septum initiation protein DivIVA
MRVVIPDEIRKAEQVLAQRDRLLAQAQEEANRTLAIAREKSDQMLERDALVQAAQSRADQVNVQMREDIEKERREADEYVLQTLTRLEVELDRYLTQVRNGIHAVKQQEPLQD